MHAREPDAADNGRGEPEHSHRPAPFSSPHSGTFPYAALDEIERAPVDDILFYDTPLYCHLIGTDSAQQTYHALSFQKQALVARSQNGDAPPSSAETADRDHRAEGPTRSQLSYSTEGIPADSIHNSTLPVTADGIVYRTAQYTAVEAQSLMQTLAEQPGVRTGRLYAMLGCVRFLEGYHVVVAARRRLVARIGAHRIFAVGDIRLLPLTIDPQRLKKLYEETAAAAPGAPSAASKGGTSAPAGSSGSSKFSVSSAASYVAAAVAASSSVLLSRRSQEEQYREQFLSQHAHRSFFYSHTYDLTNTLQVNMTTQPASVSAEDVDSATDSEMENELYDGRESYDATLSSLSPTSPPSSRGNGVGRQRRMKYVWNEFFLEPFAVFDSIHEDDGHDEDLNSEQLLSASLRDSTKSRTGDGASGVSTQSTSSQDTSQHSTNTRATVRAWEAAPLTFTCVPFAETWVVYMIRGWVVQRAITSWPSQRLLLLALIARVSKEAAGTRYLRRGVNMDGHVANHVEVEQILCDEASLNTHYTQGRFSSYTQVRGSVPVRWYHPPNASLPKPPIVVAEADPYHNASCKHFQELLADYGAPIVAMDFMKQGDKNRREAALGDAYREVVATLRGAIHDARGEGRGPYNADDVLRYRAIDLRAVADRAWNVVTAAAEEHSERIGFFATQACGTVTSRQSGVLRSNCVDCVDRTNIGQFFFSLEVLGHQLVALGVLGRNSDCVMSHSVAEELLSMFLAVGDALATQYGGSAQVGAGVLHRGRGWDKVMGIKRLYANMVSDARKQFVLNLYLGRFQPNPRYHFPVSIARQGQASGRQYRRGTIRSRMCNRHMRVITNKEHRTTYRADPSYSTRAVPADNSSTTSPATGTRPLVSLANVAAARGLLAALPSHIALDTQRVMDALDGVEDGETDTHSVPDADRMSDASASTFASTVQTGREEEERGASLNASLTTVPFSLQMAATPDSTGDPREEQEEDSSRTNPTRQSFLQRLRAAPRSFLGHHPTDEQSKTQNRQDATAGSARQQRSGRAIAGGGEAEPDYYLQVKGAPRVPRPRLLWSWWVAPLAEAELGTRTAAKQPLLPRRGGSVEEDGEASADMKLRQTFQRADTERRLALNPPLHDVPGHYDRASSQDAHLVGAATDAAYAPRGALVHETHSSLEDEGVTMTENDDTLETRWGCLVRRLHERFAVALDDVHDACFDSPVKQKEFTHSQTDFPRVVRESVYQRNERISTQMSETCYQGASEVQQTTRDDAFRGPTNEERTVVASLRSWFGEGDQWTSDDLAAALRWLDPLLARTTTDFVSEAGITGLSVIRGQFRFPDAFLQSLSEPESDRILKVLGLLRRVVQATPATLSMARMSDSGNASQPPTAAELLLLRQTATFLQPFFLEPLTTDDVVDVVWAWKHNRLLHPRHGLTRYRTRYRFSGSFYPSYSSDKLHSTQSLASDGSTPPVPIAFAVRACVSARDLLDWLLSDARNPSSPLTFSQQTSTGRPRRAAWIFTWWMLVAGIVRPVVAADTPPSVPTASFTKGAQAWEVLADPTALFRVDGHECVRSPASEGAQDAVLNRITNGPVLCSPQVLSPQAAVALAESLCSAALSALCSVLRIPVNEPNVFEDIVSSLTRVLGESATALRAVDVLSLPSNARLPFWVNLFNALYVHAWMEASLPMRSAALASCGGGTYTALGASFEAPEEDVMSFYESHGYLVGDTCFTLFDIKYGILCRNQSPASAFLPPFPPALFKERLCHLVPMAVGTAEADGVGLEEALTITLTELQGRARIEDVSVAAPHKRATSEAIRMLFRFIRAEQQRFLQGRVLVALMDAYLPLPLTSTGALLSGTTQASSGSFSTTNTSSAATLLTPQSALHHASYAEAISSLYTHTSVPYSPRDSDLSATTGRAHDGAPPEDALAAYGFDATESVGGSYLIRCSTRGSAHSLPFPLHPSPLTRHSSPPSNASSFAGLPSSVPRGDDSDLNASVCYPRDDMARRSFSTGSTHTEVPAQREIPSTLTARPSGKDMWAAGDVSACLAAAAQIRDWGQRNSHAFAPPPPPPCHPRRVRMRNYLKLQAATAIGGTNGLADVVPKSVAHLCGPLVGEDWHVQLLQTEHSLLHTLLTVQHAPLGSQLVAPLLTCQPCSLPLGQSYSDVLHALQLSRKSGARVHKATEMLRTLRRMNSVADDSAVVFREWEKNVHAFADTVSVTQDECTEEGHEMRHRENSPMPLRPKGVEFLVPRTPTR